MKIIYLPPLKDARRLSGEDTLKSNVFNSTEKYRIKFESCNYIIVIHAGSGDKIYYYRPV